MYVSVHELSANLNLNALNCTQFMKIYLMHAYLTCKGKVEGDTLSYIKHLLLVKSIVLIIIY